MWGFYHACHRNQTVIKLCNEFDKIRQPMRFRLTCATFVRPRPTAGHITPTIPQNSTLVVQPSPWPRAIENIRGQNTATMGLTCTLLHHTDRYLGEVTCGILPQRDEHNRRNEAAAWALVLFERICIMVHRKRVTHEREIIAFGEHSPYAEGARHCLLRTS